MKTIYNRSNIMIIAWAFRKEYNMLSGEAQSLSWSNAKLKIALHKGPVKFTYKKKNGEIRQAIGTLHNVQSLLVGSDKFQSDILTLRYYDLEKEAFRAMKMSNLISVNNFIIL